VKLEAGHVLARVVIPRHLAFIDKHRHRRSSERFGYRPDSEQRIHIHRVIFAQFFCSVAPRERLIALHDCDRQAWYVKCVSRLFGYRINCRKIHLLSSPRLRFNSCTIAFVSHGCQTRGGVCSGYHKGSSSRRRGAALASSALDDAQG
jgi:hypothetical protein